MFEALVITLREGVEAALVLAIALTLLRRRNLTHLRPALFAGAGLALAASVATAFLVARLTFDEELAGGIAMLVGAALVVSLVWWMWRAAPKMQTEIENGLVRAVNGKTAGAGVFLFAFGMVFREGAETALFLSAAGFNSQGLSLWFGALMGVALAAVFGILFVRGTLKIPLKPFFTITSAVLILIALQLLVGGLHELSEAEVLPSSKAEMAIIGPIVRNELLFFALIVALAAGWLLLSTRSAAPGATDEAASGPEARLLRAARARDRSLRRWTGAVGLLVLGVLTTAFVDRSRLPERPSAQPVAFENGRARIDAATLRDGHLHFFEVTVPEGPVRFFVVQVGTDLKSCFDACEICGDKGYFEDKRNAVCRNCTAPLAFSTLGRSGGCNPIPLPNRLEGGTLSVSEADVRAAVPHLKGR